VVRYVSSYSSGFCQEGAKSEHQLDILDGNIQYHIHSYFFMFKFFSVEIFKDVNRFVFSFAGIFFFVFCNKNNDSKIFKISRREQAISKKICGSCV
jgi:hypothetical protein